MKRASDTAKRSGRPARTLRRESRGATSATTASDAQPGRDALLLLQDALGYHFQDQALLTLALTHSSFVYEERLGRARASGDEPNQPGTDNEQLEFLGDAVLGLVVTELLLAEFPERTEGELTRMRAALVSRKRLAALGAQLGLGDLLRMGRSAEAGDGRQKTAVLANTTEAVLGAIYRDLSAHADARARTSERALRFLRQLAERLLVASDLPAIRAELEASEGRGALRDAKSRLQERVQAERLGRLFYADIDESGPAHARQFRVEARLELSNGTVRGLATAEGGSKKEAQQAAAGRALEHWEQQPLGSKHERRPKVGGAKPGSVDPAVSTAASAAGHGSSPHRRAETRAGASGTSSRERADA